MTAPKALIFDVGGTVFDWKSSVVTEIKRSVGGALSPQEREAFADDWRAKMFDSRAQVAEGHAPWMNSDEMLLTGLKALEADYSFIRQLDCPHEFTRNIWHNLHTFKGAQTSLSRLQSKYTMIILTVLSWASAVNSSKRAGIAWDGILSCEFIGYYKPSLMAYRRALELLGIAPDEAMMVASHEADLAAAKTAGLQTAFITPTTEDNVFKAGFADKDAFKFDVNAANFDDLCKQLGC